MKGSSRPFAQSASTGQRLLLLGAANRCGSALLALPRLATRLVLPAIASLCTSCALPSDDRTVVRNVEHAPLYSPQIVRWAAADRDLTLMLIVDAEPDRVAAWEQATGTALSDLATSAVGRVTASPDGSQRPNFHLAVVVDAPVTMTATLACQGGINPSSLAPVNGRTHILLAFCNGDKPVSTARAVTTLVAGPSSPTYVAALQAAATQAMPRNDPEQAKGSEPFLVP